MDVSNGDNMNISLQHSIETNFGDNPSFILWKKKRKITTIIICVSGALMGLEYSAVVLSLWFYMKDTIKVKNAPIFYSLGMTATALSSVLSSATMGKYIDKSRNIRRYMLIVNTLNVVGNIIYTLNFSVLFPIIGRFICGISDSLNGAMTGELARAYTSDELAIILSKYQAVYNLGFVIGPATSILFENVDFHIGGWHLNKTNFIGIFLAIIVSIFNIAVYFGVTNLSKEYDIKFMEERMSRDKNITNDELFLDEHEHTSLINTNSDSEKLLSLKDVLSNFRMVLIYISASILCYVSVTVELLVPLVSSRYFKWNQWKISIILTVCVIFFVLVMFTCASKVLSKKSRTYPLYVGSVFLTGIAPVLLIIPGAVRIDSIYLQVFLMSVAILLNSFIALQAMSLSRTILLNMTPSHSANFSEGIRLACTRMFALIGFFNAGLIFPHLEFVSTSIFILTFCLGMILLAKREQFSSEYDEKEKQFPSEYDEKEKQFPSEYDGK